MKKALLISAVLSVLSLSAQAATECSAVEASPITSAPTAAPAPPAAVSAPAPAPTAAPAPSAAPLAAKTTAVTLRAVALRDRPKQNSMGEVVAPAEQRVKLERRTQNADGNWWFVTADGLGGGWVQESDIGSPQQ